MAEEVLKDKIIVNSGNIIMVKKKIKDCNKHNLTDFIMSHFVIFFLDLQELNKFILYLFEKKGKSTIEEIINNFNDILKEFRTI